MSTLFIADLHLDPRRSEGLELFDLFLKRYASQCEALYILGDLFEFWIGDDFVPPGLEAVIAELTEFACQTPTYFLHGNRDFTIGDEFAAATHIRLLNQHQVIHLYGRPTLLLHGDSLCTDDVEYQQLRQMVRNPKWLAATLAKPVEERLQLARQLRDTSKEKTAGKQAEIMDVNHEATLQAFKEHHVCQMIHGHTHRQAVHEYAIDGRTCQRYVLGDWFTTGSVLIANENGLKLENFSLEADEV